MTDPELQAKATIAAALIASHAVDMPNISRGSVRAVDHAAKRLRELTDYVYHALTDIVD